MPIITKVLAAHVEVRKREQYCILINHRQAGFEILHPSEAYILSLLDGNIEESDLENIVSAVYGISPDAAKDLAGNVLRSYVSYMADFSENAACINPGKPEDFLYPGCEEVGDLIGSLFAPLVITLDLTRRCNFRCRYCYYGKRLSRGSDMPADRALKIIDDAANSGVVQVFFGGAESMLHPDFLEIVRNVKMRGMALSFTTNGSFLDRKMVSRLVENGVESIGVSIDSPDPEIHHMLTRSVDTFDRVISGIRELKAGGIWVRTLSVMTSHNVCTAPALIDLLMDLGVDAIHICPYSERSCEGKKRDFQGSLNSEERLQLAALVEEKQDRYRDRMISFDTREDTWKGPQNIRPCTHLAWGFVVHHNGNVFPCELIEDAELCFGNLFEAGIRDIWAGDKRREFVRNTTDTSLVDGECVQCPFLSKCHTGCFNLARVVSGNYFAKDPRCPGRERMLSSLST